MEHFVQMLSPIALHIAEELSQILGNTETITYQPWPEYDEELTIENEVEIVVQVNGKIMERANIPTDMDKDAMIEMALDLEKVKAAIEGKTLWKKIAVPGKLVNIVVG
ncbi:MULTISPECIES: class I tRNA ligase family protein [Tepidibacillus]|uniref:class I tRNA ligase family protein n=1 Tax=Tepidibacillus TaxID=1494427 RepID=UPI00191016D0